MKRLLFILLSILSVATLYADRTISGVVVDQLDEDSKHLGLLYNNETHTVCVPQPSSNARLYVLDRMGQQIYSVKEVDGQYIYQLPTEGFTRGQLYIVKQVENGRVRLKQRYVKFVY